MKTVYITLFYQPGTSHIQSIESRAERMIELGVISAMPDITTKQSEKLPIFWNLILSVKEQDWPFWMGFWMGKDFSVNNRGIAVGVD